MEEHKINNFMCDICVILGQAEAYVEKLREMDVINDDCVERWLADKNQIINKIKMLASKNKPGGD